MSANNPNKPPLVMEGWGPAAERPLDPAGLPVGYRWFDVPEGNVFEVLPGATQNDRVWSQIQVAPGVAGAVFASPTGNDANPGTAALPVETFERAWALANDPNAIRDQIRLAPGEYLVTGPSNVEFTRIGGRLLTIVGPPLALVRTITSQAGSNRNTIGDATLTEAPGALEGLTLICTASGDPANVDTQRTIKQSLTGSVVIGTGLPGAPGVGSVFDVREAAATLVYDQSISWLLAGGDVQFLGVDVRADASAQWRIFDGALSYTAGIADQQFQSAWILNTAILALGASDVTDANFGDRSFAGCSAAIQNGDVPDFLGICVYARASSRYVLDGGLMKRGIALLSQSTSTFEASDIANGNLYAFNGSSIDVIGAEFAFALDPARARVRIDEPFVGRTGATATIAAVGGGGGGDEVTLTNVVTDPADVGLTVRIAGAATSRNNGVFEVTAVLSGTSWRVRNANGVFPDVNSGAIAWTVYNRQVMLDQIDLLGRSGGLVVQDGSSCNVYGGSVSDTVHSGILATNGSAYTVQDFVGTGNTDYGQQLDSGSAGQMVDPTTVTGYGGDALIGATLGVYGGNLAPGLTVTSAARLSLLESI